MSNIPRKEYPRPQFVRENWMNLNGTWAFEIDNGRSGEARGLQKVGTALSGEITVPFCPESELSGVQHTGFMYGVWYKRIVTVTEKQLKGPRRAAFRRCGLLRKSFCERASLPAHTRVAMFRLSLT